VEYKQIKTSEQELFKKYFNTYYKPIRNYLYYKCGDVDVADDTVQQVFMKLWEVRDTIKPETVKALLYSIATNALLNHFKHQKVVYNFVATQISEEQVSESADFDLQQNEFKEKLQRVLDKMPEKTREIFLMNRIEELKYSEIAERLDLSVKAIEKRMHQALEIVRENISYKI
jgi:RNA polymerase sigma-70 factor (family 1)